MSCRLLFLPLNTSTAFPAPIRFGLCHDELLCRCSRILATRVWIVQAGCFKESPILSRTLVPCPTIYVPGMSTTQQWPERWRLTWIGSRRLPHQGHASHTGLSPGRSMNDWWLITSRSRSTTSRRCLGNTNSKPRCECRSGVEAAVNHQTTPNHTLMKSFPST